jgi:hydroxymethylpyrimidine pyrophosphatase-like HAD family hydrolase
MALKGKISLVLADVDGTLITEQKLLTRRTQSAVKALQDAGIRFAVTSGRPPRGMAMLFEPLDLNTPIAGFNGGLFVERDLTILAQKTVPADVARQAIARMVSTPGFIVAMIGWSARPMPHMSREKPGPSSSSRMLWPTSAKSWIKLPRSSA